jgi:hypothetical protein
MVNDDAGGTPALPGIDVNRSCVRAAILEREPGSSLVQFMPDEDAQQNIAQTEETDEHPASFFCYECGAVLLSPNVVACPRCGRVDPVVEMNPPDKLLIPEDAEGFGSSSYWEFMSLHRPEFLGVMRPPDALWMLTTGVIAVIGTCLAAIVGIPILLIALGVLSLIGIGPQFTVPIFLVAVAAAGFWLGKRFRRL